MCISVWAVQHGLVYRLCKEDGQWAQKNTSECEDDPGEVCVYSAACSCLDNCCGFPCEKVLTKLLCGGVLNLKADVVLDLVSLTGFKYTRLFENQVPVE